MVGFAPRHLVARIFAEFRGPVGCFLVCKIAMFVHGLSKPLGKELLIHTNESSEQFIVGREHTSRYSTL